MKNAKDNCSNLITGKDYFMKASVILNEAGHECRKNNHLENAIKSYEKAIECVRKGNNGEDS